MKRYQKCKFILILDGVLGLNLIQTFLKNLDPPPPPPGFPNYQIDIGTFLVNEFLSSRSTSSTSHQQKNWFVKLWF